MEFSAQQLTELTDEVAKAMRGRDLELLVEHVSRQLPQGLSVPMQLSESSLSEFVNQAHQEGWIDDLIVSAVELRPDSGLRDFANRAVQSVVGKRIDETIRTSGSDLDYSQWLMRSLNIGKRTCRIEQATDDPRQCGNGIVIGPTAILTAYHVLADVIERAATSAYRFRFSRAGAEQVIDLEPSDDWLWAASPPDELDFVVVRVPQLLDDLSWRGFATFREGVYTFPESAWLAVPHQGSDGELRFPFGQRGPRQADDRLDGLRPRVSYQADIAADSSGAACLDANLEPVALHLKISEGEIAHGVPLFLVRDWLIEAGDWGAILAPESEAAGSTLSVDENYQAIRSARQQVSTGSQDVKVLSYLQAASVLDEFDMSTLRPPNGGPTPDADVKIALFEHCTGRPDEDGRVRWTLRDEQRRSLLAGFTTRSMLKNALDANPDRKQSMLQEIIDGYVTGTAPPVAEQSLEQLVASAQVVDWFEGVPSVDPITLPFSDNIAIQIRWLRVLQRLEHLVGKHFQGRTTELGLLNQYVFDEQYEFEREVFEESTREPLMFAGVGGIGKTALLSKFILSEILSDGETQVPFAYFDFDRSSISPADPAGLFADALEQLLLQFPYTISYVESLRLELKKATEEADGTLSLTSQEALDWISRFGGLIESLDKPNTLVLFFETFEEVQRRSREHVAHLIDFVRVLNSRLPQISTRGIFAGRGPIEKDAFAYRNYDINVHNYPLTHLDKDAAVARLTSLEVEPEVAEMIFDQLGGHPLVLKLAAALVKRSQEESPADWDFRDTEVQRDLQDTVIQGFLFDRILGHINEPQVRDLAYPGLVLRRITEDLIGQVLAKGCKLELPEDPQERHDRITFLFSSLADETALVSEEEDGVLRHRPELRKEMLRLLKITRGEQVDTIHKLAKEYYQSHHDTPQERAELLYHMLALGDPREELDPLWHEWSTEIETLLEDALDELPASSVRYLASSHSGGLEAGGSSRLSSQIWEQAELANWERRTEKRLEKLLGVGELDQALAVLLERQERSDESPLFLLEARTLRESEQPELAFTLVKEAIPRVMFTGNQRLLLDLLFESCQSGWQAPEIENEQWNGSVQWAEKLCESIGSPVDKAKALKWRIWLDYPVNTKLPSEVLGQVPSRLSAMSAVEMDKNRRLTRELVAEVIHVDRFLASETLHVVGVGKIEEEGISSLGQAFHKWQATAQAAGHNLSDELGVRLKDESVAGWARLIRTGSAERRDKMMGTAIVSEPASAVRSVLAALWSERLTADAPVVEARAMHTSNVGQLEEIHAALIDAFSASEIDHLFRSELSIPIDEVISPDSGLSSMIFQLLKHCEAHGLIPDLIDAVIRARPDNRRNQDLSAYTSSDSPALATWREKLRFLENELARESFAERKFYLHKQIEESKRKIEELGNQPHVDTESDSAEIAILIKKLSFLQVEEAKAADPERKFYLHEQVEEMKRRIEELRNQQPEGE